MQPGSEFLNCLRLCPPRADFKNLLPGKFSLSLPHHFLCLCSGI